MPRREPLDHVNLRVGRMLFLFHLILLMPFNYSVCIQWFSAREISASYRIF